MKPCRLTTEMSRFSLKSQELLKLTMETWRITKAYAKKAHPGDLEITKACAKEAHPEDLEDHQGLR